MGRVIASRPTVGTRLFVPPAIPTLYTTVLLADREAVTLEETMLGPKFAVDPCATSLVGLPSAWLLKEREFKQPFEPVSPRM